jgi:uncharacterized protein with HEPN domain
MPRHEIQKYLFDISESCSLLARFTLDKTYDDYHKDLILQSAVERQFEIIGEALNKAIRHDPALTKKITDSARIIAFRNRLIHGYATIADEVVWGVLESQLPVLMREVNQLLKETESEK